MVLHLLPSSKRICLFTTPLMILLALAFSSACQYIDNADLQNSEVLCSETAECIDAANSATALESYIENKACSSNSDCGAVGYGNKSCGGYAAYLSYSKLSTTASTLDEKRDTYFQASETCNSKCGIVSTCDVTPVPTIKCVAGKCKAT